MPRVKKEEVLGTEPKKRSRTGCWPCKGRKVKCGEERPACTNCLKSNEVCDYSIRLNWGGRSKRDKDGTLADPNGFAFVATPSSVSTAQGAHEHVFSSQHIITARRSSGHATPPTPDMQQTSHLQPTPPLPRYHTLPTSVPLNWSPRGTAKRMRTSPHMSSQPLFSYPTEQTSPNSNFTPPSIDSLVHSPAATPGSSINSGSPFPVIPQLAVREQPDLRRLSVKSLLSDPTEEPERPRYPRLDSHGCRTYGYDHGQPDLDIPLNDDRAAIQHKSPDLRRPSAAISEISTSSLEHDQRDIVFEPGGYYGKPVAVRIPRTLEPLPSELTMNNMNLLYFHHFINHTARIMVPHDCPENPLRGVLPQMAIKNKQLLHLVLAFSASHRARLLNHAEPLNRIADWMSDVLPALRTALDDENPEPIDPKDLNSLAPLTTAIMLASLEIISPNTFAVPISWQNHLDIARRILVSKGGLHRLAPQAATRDKAVFLVSRWFAYLDVLGSLSGGKYRRPLRGAYLEDGGGSWLVNRNDDEVYRIDCFFGFSGRCIALLAAVADLAAGCDEERIDPETRRERPYWQPSEDVKRQARLLQERLIVSAGLVSGGCMHTEEEIPGGGGLKSDTDRDEMLATNEAFHWAGMLHLLRRVLALPREAPEVQLGVKKVLAALARVRQNSTAESCLLFPMFTAGCECIDQAEQEIFLRRMRAVEGWGMQHVGRGRELMETVWRTGSSWEVLSDGEFFA
ncbi:hypothetical protein AMS68_002214 [Peltaster fructicola]|uniref:Zn(2)-C6 fungal-type domain-containing protein n=1 Tax=Peltaster fructicola TaxID=286661 RepID=A0A6H0XPK8_9PEZI|nr:hypothetical protein AMS68_002214 [Peltaster fructicola]